MPDLAADCLGPVQVLSTLVSRLADLQASDDDATSRFAEPWAGGVRNGFIAITPESVTGRAVRSGWGHD